MAQKHIPHLPPVPRAAPLPAGLPYRLTERQLGLLLHQPRTAPRWQSTLACLRAIERENYLEQRAILVLFDLNYGEPCFHPNVQSARNVKNVVKYVVKGRFNGAMQDFVEHNMSAQALLAKKTLSQTL